MCYSSPTLPRAVRNQQLGWHQHEHEDEMFPVVYGRLRLPFEDKEGGLNAGGPCVAAENTMHNPMADEE